MRTAHTIFALAALMIMFFTFYLFWWLGFELRSVHVLCAVGS